MPVKNPPRTNIKIGPFVGGMNFRNTGYTDDIADDECRWIKNLDPTTDELRQRRGARRTIFDSGTFVTNVTAYVFMGQYLLPGATDTALHAIVGRIDSTNGKLAVYTSDGNGVLNTGGTRTSDWIPIVYDPHGDGPGIFRSADPQMKVVYYNNAYYFIGNKGAAGTAVSHKVPDLKVNSGTTFVAPHYGGATVNNPDTRVFIWKDRMFIVDFESATVYWSKATDPTVWTAPDGGFFKLAAEDKRPITEAFVDNDTLYIFKREGFWQFNFGADPAIDGQLRQSSKSEGAFFALQYRDRNFIVNTRGVFEFTNGNFLDISWKMAFDFNANERLPAVLNVVNNMLILGLTTGRISALFDCYAMNLDTGAWTGYDFHENADPTQGAPGPFSKGLSTYSGSYRRTIFGHGRIRTSNMVDRLAIGGYETRSCDLRADLNYWSPEYSFISKAYSLGDPTEVKRFYEYALEARSQAYPGEVVSYHHDLYLNRSNPVGAADITVNTTTLKTGASDQRMTVPIPGHRAKMVAVGLRKDPSNLGAVEPADIGLVLTVYQWIIRVMGKNISTTASASA